MSRTLLLALIASAGLVFCTPTHARMNFEQPVTKPQLTTVQTLVLPIKVFVTVSQKPVVMMNKSLMSILRQVLTVPKKSPGMPIKGNHVPRI